MLIMSQDEKGREIEELARKKERLTIRTPEDDAASKIEVRQSRDPVELRIYIKQLSRALRFLPLGSRAYYAVTGELLRANTQLKAIVPAGSAVKGEH